MQIPTFSELNEASFVGAPGTRRHLERLTGLDRIVAELSLKPLTNKQLVALTGIARGTVSKYLRELCNGKPRRAHISGFDQDTAIRGRRGPVFALGDHPDAIEPHKRNKHPKPHANPKSQRKQAEMAQHKAAANVAHAISRPRGIFDALGL